MVYSQKCVKNAKMNIIIMHYNERTVGMSVKIAEFQGAKVHLVTNKPFHKTLRDAFKLAITLNEEWVVIMGGDQMLFPFAVQKMESIIKTLGKDVFRVSFMGWDKLWMQERLMPPCIYRTELLKTALKYNFKKQSRPETFVYTKMIEAGYKGRVIKSMICIHDDEQYYRDIYRKGKEQAKKSMSYFTEEFREKLRKSNDKDHEIFLRGILNLGYKIEEKNERI